ncbi:50S ribosomal protein L25/general stress protein Ctc [Actinomycetaceae bacterium WB03_NA08]|uniref:Large ribosomal subunit protein bL25 n=1 Tax=Scrofimicrobium canadense TaxID=2652290 RepID=A0A6N7W377_9ACTO|nr:50S ribosomal protein L25/general stress protein Ctc [Scrofimicrobium canadense]MSS83745.1 50S ribosomal protein L25/general stress protein Ctc [Scrofimicrobium canadense]
MATENHVLNAQVRTETGKGPARRARRAGLVPAVMYGKGFEPVHLDLPGHGIFLIVKDSANAVIEVSYDGNKQLCLVKAVQTHPVSRNILHVDLLVVTKDQKVDVEVPIVLVGEPAPGTQTQQEEFALPVKASATAIPESIEVSVEGLAEGTVVRVSDLQLPAGVEAEQDANQDIVSIIAITDQVDVVEDAEEALAEATQDNDDE